jgi:hypothetical protein
MCNVDVAISAAWRQHLRFNQSFCSRLRYDLLHCRCRRIFDFSDHNIRTIVRIRCRPTENMLATLLGANAEVYRISCIFACTMCSWTSLVTSSNCSCSNSGVWRLISKRNSVDLINFQQLPNTHSELTNVNWQAGGQLHKRKTQLQ